LLVDADHHRLARAFAPRRGLGRERPLRRPGQRWLRRLTRRYSASARRSAAGHDPVLRTGPWRSAHPLQAAYCQRASGTPRVGDMTGELVIAICLAAIASGTSILLPALGEAITERSGVQNLGVEGMLLMVALFGYIVDIETENIVLAFVAAAVAAMSLAIVHAFLSITLRANQIASGLAV